MDIPLKKYVIVSLALGGLVIQRALLQYPSYYSATEALTRSLISALAVGNLAVVFSVLIVKAVARCFFRKVLPQEYQNALRAICLDAFDIACIWSSYSLVSNVLPQLPHVLNILSCGFIQSILSERVQYVYSLSDPSQAPSWRIWVLSIGLVIYDLTIVKQEFGQASLIMRNSRNYFPPSLYYFVESLDLLFTSFVCLTTLACNYYEARVINKDIDLETEELDDWETKNIIIFAADMTSNCLLLCFDVYLQLTSGSRICASGTRAFSMFKKIQAFLAARMARKKLNDYIVPLTKDDLERENTCVICRDEMDIDAVRDRQKPAKLACGHVIHFGCLKSWITRSQNCPICRQTLESAKSAFKTDKHSLNQHLQALHDLLPQPAQNPIQPQELEQTQPEQAPEQTSEQVRSIPTPTEQAPEEVEVAIEAPIEAATEAVIEQPRSAAILQDPTLEALLSEHKNGLSSSGTGTNKESEIAASADQITEAFASSSITSKILAGIPEFEGSTTAPMIELIQHPLRDIVPNADGFSPAQEQSRLAPGFVSLSVRNEQTKAPLSASDLRSGQAEMLVGNTWLKVRYS